MVRLLGVYTLHGNYIGNHLITTSSMDLVRYVQVTILRRVLRPFVAQSKQIDCSVPTRKLTYNHLIRRDFSQQYSFQYCSVFQLLIPVATYASSSSDVLTFHSLQMRFGATLKSAGSDFKSLTIRAVSPPKSRS
jgi:hypothetical protein